MKLADFPLRKSYFDALKGNVTYNGKTVPTYDRVTNSAGSPRIKLGNQATINDQDKDKYNTEILMTIEVYTSFKRGGGKRQADEIANQITQLIIGQTLDLSPDFVCHEQRLESVDFIEDITGDAYVYNKIIIINNLIEQIT